LYSLNLGYINNKTVRPNRIRLEIPLLLSTQENSFGINTGDTGGSQSITQLRAVTDVLGRAMAQAVSRRPLTADAQIQSRVSPCGICGGQSGTGTGFSPSTSVFPRQFHSTGAPLQGKTKKKNNLHHMVAQ
jgi:hypothetical protein